VPISIVSIVDSDRIWFTSEEPFAVDVSERVCTVDHPAELELR
jgi:hypothetical protein